MKMLYVTMGLSSWTNLVRMKEMKTEDADDIDINE